MNKQIAFVEAHDSRLEAMTIRPGGSVILLLARLGVYASSGADRYDIWSHRAELQLEGVTQLHVTGAVPDDGWIVDHAVIGTAERQPQLLDCLEQPVPIREFALTFRDGTRLTLSAQTMAIRLKDDGAVVDSWEGPL